MKKFGLKKVLAVGVACVMALSLAACGSSSSSSSSKKESTKSTGKSSGTLIVVTEPTFPPFDTTNDQGEIDGFDRDVMEAIAKDQGLKLEFKSMEFQSLVPAIQAGNADIIAAGMNAEDPERRKKVDFTDTYYDSGLVVMVKNDNNTIKSEDDLTTDMKVASQTGTTGADEANRLKDDGKIQEAVILDGFDTCILQLQNGDVDAIIIDKPVAENYMKQHEGQFKTVGKVLNAESYGFAVKKGNTKLLKKLNTGLKDIVKSGEFKKLCDKWGIDSKFDK
ncbi:MAG: basic amino acid ABC transporter substrate-binding protein [Eubacteriales bacterium]|nr:basic amino acid ABC transporter substrate-binding protein [Eubacteriales bacterium]